MKTAVQLAIQKLESETLQNYSYEDVLEILENCEIIQDAQIKIAYLHGGMAVLEKTDVTSDEYFANEFKN